MTLFLTFFRPPPPRVTFFIFWSLIFRPNLLWTVIYIIKKVSLEAQKKLCIPNSLFPQKTNTKVNIVITFIVMNQTRCRYNNIFHNEQNSNTQMYNISNKKLYFKSNILIALKKKFFVGEKNHHTLFLQDFFLHQKIHLYAVLKIETILYRKWYIALKMDSELFQCCTRTK